jgi:hypothetical protein
LGEPELKTATLYEQEQIADRIGQHADEEKDCQSKLQPLLWQMMLLRPSS